MPRWPAQLVQLLTTLRRVQMGEVRLGLGVVRVLTKAVQPRILLRRHHHVADTRLARRDGHLRAKHVNAHHRRFRWRGRLRVVQDRCPGRHLKAPSKNRCRRVGGRRRCHGCGMRGTWCLSRVDGRQNRVFRTYSRFECKMIVSTIKVFLVPGTYISHF